LLVEGQRLADQLRFLAHITAHAPGQQIREVTVDHGGGHPAGESGIRYNPPHAARRHRRFRAAAAHASPFPRFRCSQRHGGRPSPRSAAEQGPSTEARGPFPVRTRHPARTAPSSRRRPGAGIVVRRLRLLRPASAVWCPPGVQRPVPGIQLLALVRGSDAAGPEHQLPGALGEQAADVHLPRAPLAGHRSGTEEASKKIIELLERRPSEPESRSHLVHPFPA
jgi:hypothetical protein